MAKHDNLSSIILQRIPEFITDEYPLFKEFLLEYYTWMDDTQHVNDEFNFTNALIEFAHKKDVASQDSTYIDVMLRSMGFDVERELKVGKHFLALFLREFYLSRGSQQSFRFLFKLFFNKDVSINYPRRMLAKSSGVVFSGNSVMVSTGNSINTPAYRAIVEDASAQFSTSITGQSSGAQTSVERMSGYTFNGQPYLEFVVADPDKPFMAGETLVITYADHKIIEANVPCVNLQVNNSGHTYGVNDHINVGGTEVIRPGKYRVSRVQHGAIDAVSIVNAGASYQIGDAIYPDNAQSGAGMYAEVTSVNMSGGITGVSVIEGGWRYESAPNLIIVSDTGTGGILTCSGSKIGGVVAVEAITPALALVAPNSVTTAGSGAGAAFNMQLDAVYHMPARHTDSINGILGRSCVLTDSNLYQQYSYEIISDESPDSYKDLTGMVHPAGYKKFNVLSLKSSADKLDFSTSLVWRKTLKIKPYKLADFPVSGVMHDSVEKFMLIKVISSTDLVKPSSMSINMLDSYKFSDAQSYSPLQISERVMSSVLSNQFINEALDARITITPV